MQYSSYQQKIFEIFENTNDNLCIEAGPGSGKTTLLVELANRIPRYKKAIFLAFNKKIVEELKTKLPSNVDCYTLHSFGYRVLLKHIQSKIKLSQYKIMQLSNPIVKKLNLDDNDEFKYKIAIQSIIDFARITKAPQTKEGFENIVDNYDILCENGEIENSLEVYDTLKGYNKGKHEEFLIDFIDMLYLPLFLNMQIPQYDVVAIDECFPYNQYIVVEGEDKKKIGNLVNMFNRGIKVPRVLSFNEERGIFEYKRILNVWERGYRSLIELTIGSKRKIKCTPEHLLYSIDGWKKACDFNIGDILISNCNDQPYSSLLNEDQFQLVIASKIGDGHIEKMYNNLYRGSFIHGKKQKDYLYWKARMFNQEYLVRYIEKNGYSKKPAYYFCSRNFYIEDYYFKDNNFIRYLDEKGIAILFMDDGYFVSKRCNYKLYSYSTDKIGINMLCYHINHLFNINGRVVSSFSSTTKNKYWLIIFNKDDSYFLSEKLSKYFHFCFKYKVHNDHKKLVNNYNWKNNDFNIGCSIISNIQYLDKKQKVYDIEVEDNNNFIITSSSKYKNRKEGANSGFIAHNCQDLNPLQHELLSKIIKRNGRVCAVGDKKQSIYAFSGADIYSISNFQKKFKTTNLPLSISYRLPLTGVKHAQQLNPDLEPNETAIEGELILDGKIEDIQHGDFVVCRNVRPLIDLHFMLIEQEKRATIVGRDIEKGLLNVVKGLEGDNLGLHESIQALDAEKQHIIETLKNKGIRDPLNHFKYVNFEEKANIVILFLRKYDYISVVKQKIKDIFHNDDKKAIKLMTIHKAKGLEADNVFYLSHYDGKKLIPSKYAITKEQLQQERNLDFVARTRHKKKLAYIKL